MSGFRVKLFFLLISAIFLTMFCATTFVLAEDKAAPGQMIPKLPKTNDDPELLSGRVYPFWGPVCQRYTYSVVYRDKEGREPEYVKMYFNGQMIDLPKANNNDDDYKKGVRYEYKFVPNKLGSNFYYFEASNGLGKARESIIDSPDNGPVLFESAFDKNEIALIEAQNGRKLASFSTAKEWVGGIALSADGQYLAAKTSQHIYLFKTDEMQKPVWQFNCEQCRIGDDVKGGVAISADGSKIFSAIGEFAILFNKSSSVPVWKYRLGNAYNVALSKDGQVAAAATAGEEANPNSNLIIVWKTGSDKPLWQYHASGNFHDVSLSDDGSFITGSTGCPDRRAYLFSLNSNQPLIRTEPLTQDSPVHRAKISADGTSFAVGSEAGAGAVFAFRQGAAAPEWKYPTPGNSSVRALNITSDGKYIGAATFKGDIYIFDNQNSQPINSWKIPVSVGAIDIADDGRFVATGGTDNQVHLLSSDASLNKNVSLAEYVSEIDISANGKYVAAGTGGSVYFFETLVRDENKIYSCDKIIEPPGEKEFMAEYMGENNDGKEPLPDIPFLKSKTGSKTKKLPGMLFGFGFLGSLMSLGFYLAVVKFNLLRRPAEKLLKFNKKIIIFLSLLSVLFLILTITAMVFNKTEQVELRPSIAPGFSSPVNQVGPDQEQINSFQGQPGAEDQDQLQDKSTGVCGNNLCEPDLGETKQSCPQDCSAGD